MRQQYSSLLCQRFNFSPILTPKLGLLLDSFTDTLRKPHQRSHQQHHSNLTPARAQPTGEGAVLLVGPRSLAGTQWRPQVRHLCGPEPLSHSCAAQGGDAVPPHSLAVPDQPTQKTPLIKLATGKAKLSKCVQNTEKVAFPFSQLLSKFSVTLACLRFFFFPKKRSH